jgi:hypothetical protein
VVSVTDTYGRILGFLDRPINLVTNLYPVYSHLPSDDNLYCGKSIVRAQ